MKHGQRNTVAVADEQGFATVKRTRDECRLLDDVIGFHEDLVELAQPEGSEYR